MDFESLHINWVDFLIVLVLLFGIMRGRKRGMSEELLDVIKWVLIVGVAAYAYEPLGQLLASLTVFSSLFCYVTVYALIMLAFVVGVAYLRPTRGDKLVGTDFFGNGEYYLGMAAGAFRYLCIILVLFALLNARQFSGEEIRQENAFQENNFGSIRFPTLITLHTAVLENSMSGSLARTYLSSLLIRSTAPEEKQLGKHNIVRTRERMMDDILEKR